MLGTHKDCVCSNRSRICRKGQKTRVGRVRRIKELGAETELRRSIDAFEGKCEGLEHDNRQGGEWGWQGDRGNGKISSNVRNGPKGYNS